MKICQYLCLHIKVIRRRFRIKTFYVLRYAHVTYVQSLLTNIQKQQNTLKIRPLLRDLQTLRASNSKILWIKKAKLSRYCIVFIWTETNREIFQICISVPLQFVIFKTAKLLFWRNNRIWRKSLVCKSSRVVQRLFMDWKLQTVY